MSSRTLSRLMTGLLIIVMIAVLGAPIGSAMARSNQRQAAGELLTNPGFESPFVQEGTSDIFVANGWQAWYIIPGGVTYPTDCPNGAPATCKPYRIPVYRNSQPQDARIPPRARSGNSQQWGIQYAVYVAGVYQRVSGLTPGARLHFSAYLQGFNCSNDRGCFGGVGRYGYSYEPGDMQTRVGIDPTGGTSAFSPNVVWSGFQNPLDAFSLQEVEAVVPGNTATVFIWSSPTFPEKHTDVYVDDASLTVVGQGPVPATAAPTEPGATQQPAGTPSPVPTLPPGTTTYTIQSGDTLFAIALRFNLTLDQLLALNPGLTRDSLLQIGQVINVAGTPNATAQPTPPPAPTATATSAPSPTPASTLTATITSPLTSTLVTSTPTVTPTLAIANSGLCLTAYDDQNGNAERDSGEALLPGVQFVVKDTDGKTVATYTTDGVKEPHCLSNLADGRYTVSVTPPADRTATTDTSYAMALLSDTTVPIIFGSESKPAPSQLTLPPGAAPTLAVTAEAAGTRSSGGSGAPLGLLAGGAMILLAAAALAFGLSSRRK